MTSRAIWETPIGFPSSRVIKSFRNIIRSPRSAEPPVIGLQIVLQQIITSVLGTHLEVVSSGPLRLALHLTPAVEHLGDLYNVALNRETARRFIGLSPCVTFDLDRDEFQFELLPKVSLNLSWRLADFEP